MDQRDFIAGDRQPCTPCLHRVDHLLWVVRACKFFACNVQVGVEQHFPSRVDFDNTYNVAAILTGRWIAWGRRRDVLVDKRLLVHSCRVVAVSRGVDSQSHDAFQHWEVWQHLCDRITVAAGLKLEENAVG